MSIENGLTTEQVGKLLGLSERTIRNYCKDKLITHYKIGNKILILPEDVDKFIESQKIVMEEKENE